MGEESSKAELQEAIRKLEAFSEQTSRESTASPVSKTISLMRTLLGHDKTNNLQVLEAVEVINRSRLHLLKFKQGGAEEQKFADAATQAITAYNESCKMLSNKYQLPNIDMLRSSTIRYEYPPNLSRQISKKTISASIDMPKQFAELFQMKVLALLERYGIASNPEARIHVKQSPIHTSMEVDSSLCTLSQTFSLFPGQTIVVKGDSAFDSQHQTISRLFPETFSISLESTQTGFPHPSQRAGWTLGSQLLPESPQRIDLLTHAVTIFQERRQVIEELLPQGRLIDHAKRLLRLKRKAFEANCQEFLDLHKELYLAILGAGLEEVEISAARNEVEEFFCQLQSHPVPFDYLLEINQQIRDRYISKPHHELLEAVLKGRTNDFGGRDPELRYRAVQKVFESALMQARSEGKCGFMPCMGKVLGGAAKQIILQYLSEDLVYSPPVLTLFERMVQEAAYTQIKDFLEELSTSLGIDKEQQVYLMMKDQLKRDIALFRDQVDLIISDELSEYFSHRYESLKVR